MKLHSLTLTNFRQHRDSRIEFRDGLTAVLGENGAGKTTLLEAVAWALYGSAALRGVNEDVTCLSGKPRVPVQADLEFSLGGQPLRVQRRLNTASLFRGGSPNAEAITTTEVNARIERLLGMDRRQFFSSFFTGQKELAFLAELKGPDRAAVVARMLGLDRLTAGRKQADDRRRGLAAEVKALAQALGDPQAVARELKEAEQRLKHAEAALASAQKEEKAAASKLEALRPAADVSQARHERHAELDQDRGTVGLKLEHERSHQAKLEAQMQSLRSGQARLSELAPLIAEYEALKEEHARLNELQKHEKERGELAGQRKAQEDELARLAARARDLEPIAGSLPEVTAQEKAAKETADDAQAAMQQSRDDWMAAKQESALGIKQCRGRLAELKDHRRAVMEAGADGACPVCERALGDELDVVIGHFDAETNALTAKLEALNRTQAQLTPEPAALTALAKQAQTRQQEVAAATAQVVLAKAAIDELKPNQAQQATCGERIAAIDARLAALPTGFDQDRFNQVIERGKALREPYHESVRLQGELKGLPEVECGLAAAKAAADQHAARLEALERELAELAFDPAAHAALLKEAHGAEQAFHKANGERRVQETEQRNAAERLAAAERRMAECREQQQVLAARKDEYLYAETVSRWMGDLRGVLNQRIQPELESMAGDFLTSLTDGRYSELRLGEEFVPRIVQDGDEKAVISGGEEDVANLCLRLAISRLITERAGQPLSLLILDEVFGSLDGIRRDNLVRLLQSLKSQFEQIILITHVESIHDAADHCLWLRYDEKERVSVVSEASPEEVEPGVETWGRE